MRWSPSVTVAAVIRRQDRYLMVEARPDGQPVINQPAGHLDFGESIIEAVCREVLEETGRVFEPGGLVGIYQWTVPESNRTYLRFCFAGKVGEQSVGHAIDPDIVDTHWMRYAEIAQGDLPVRSPLVLRCIDDSRSGASLPPDLIRTLT